MVSASMFQEALKPVRINGDLVLLLETPRPATSATPGTLCRAYRRYQSWEGAQVGKRVFARFVYEGVLVHPTDAGCVRTSSGVTPVGRPPVIFWRYSRTRDRAQ